MFKRLFWLLMGIGFGFGVSFWITRFIRTTVERYTPERVSSDLAGALRQFGGDLRGAVQEGREAMREREAELLAELDRKHPRPERNR
ncbi:MAG TPA: hypothetical protein VM143_04895 [Acidimicrobiales bacterium]|nr:hypothetical protein [Acidimicrobiales bacterium]